MQTSSTVVRVRGGYLGLWLHTRRDPSSAEWERGLGHVDKLRDELRRQRLELKLLVLSDGGAPNALQRKQAFQLAPDTRGAVITTSLNNPIKRGIATAVSWAMPRFRFFVPDQARTAFEHLDLIAELELVWAQVLDLQAELPGLESVLRTAAALGLPEPITTSERRIAHSPDGSKGAGGGGAATG